MENEEVLALAHMLIMFDSLFHVGLLLEKMTKNFLQVMMEMNINNDQMMLQYSSL